MSISSAERKQIENEMIFRRLNEKVGDDLGELDAMHIEDDDIHLIRDTQLLLRFRCECSDEDCDERIPLKLGKYQEIHENRNTYIVLKDHQIDSIETVIAHEDVYNVVRKNNSTSEPGKDLNKTEINKS